MRRNIYTRKGIIYQQPGPTPRQPSADTIFYYKFDNNLNDEMGSYDLTVGMSSQPIVYGTTAGGATYAYFSIDCWSSQSNAIIEDWNTPHTLSFWVNAQSAGNSILLDMGYSSGDVWSRPNSNIGIGYFDQNSDPFYDIGTGTWYHIVVVRDNTFTKFYVNGNLEATGTPRPISSQLHLKINNAWDLEDSSTSDDTYLSELIFEKKGRTDQEIVDYFNTTKILYGIS